MLSGNTVACCLASQKDSSGFKSLVELLWKFVLFCLPHKLAHCFVQSTVSSPVVKLLSASCIQEMTGVILYWAKTDTWSCVGIHSHSVTCIQPGWIVYPQWAKTESGVVSSGHCVFACLFPYMFKCNKYVCLWNGKYFQDSGMHYFSLGSDWTAEFLSLFSK